jgi:hypothetical protein
MNARIVAAAVVASLCLLGCLPIPDFAPNNGEKNLLNLDPGSGALLELGVDLNLRLSRTVPGVALVVLTPVGKGGSELKTEAVDGQSCRCDGACGCSVVGTSVRVHDPVSEHTTLHLTAVSRVDGTVYEDTFPVEFAPPARLALLQPAARHWGPGSVAVIAGAVGGFRPVVVDPQGRELIGTRRRVLTVDALGSVLVRPLRSVAGDDVFSPALTIDDVPLGQSFVFSATQVGPGRLEIALGELHRTLGFDVVDDGALVGVSMTMADPDAAEVDVEADPAAALVEVVEVPNGDQLTFANARRYVNPVYLLADGRRVVAAPHTRGWASDLKTCSVFTEGFVDVHCTSRATHEAQGVLFDRDRPVLAPVPLSMVWR